MLCSDWSIRVNETECCVLNGWLPVSGSVTQPVKSTPAAAAASPSYCLGSLECLDLDRDPLLKRKSPEQAPNNNTRQEYC